MPSPDPAGGRPPEVPRKILHALLAAGPCAELSSLAAVSGVSHQSCRRHVGAAGPMRVTCLVDEDPDEGYRLGPGLGLVLSYSVGGEHLMCGLVDAGGRVHHVARDRPHPRQLTDERPDLLLGRMAKLGGEVIAAAAEPGSPMLCPTASGEPALRLIGATVSWPSPMDHRTLPLEGPIGLGWQGRTLREHLGRALDLPLGRCHAINDANAGALTLAFEQEQPRAGAVMCVHVSAGIGLGTVHQAIPTPGRLAFADAHLVGGRDGRAGEIGHCVLERGIVAELNAATASPRRQYGNLKPLDPDRPCDCAVDAHGHLEAVVGAEAVLDRLARFGEGDSLVDRLAELHAEAQRDSVVRLALMDTGRAIASVLSGAVAATDPVSVSLVGALASPYVAEGMNERFRANGQRSRVALYDGPQRDLVGLRGAALAVLRGALYRGLFDRIKRSDAAGAKVWLPEHWEGWDAAPAGAQSGDTGHAGSAWQYEPFPADGGFAARLTERADVLLHGSVAGER